MGKQAREARAAARRAGTVAIGWLHPGQVSGYFCESLVATLLWDVSQEQLGVRPRRIRNLYQEWSSANVSEPRNRIVTKFLERDDAEWLLFIDSDMAWTPEAFERLIDCADVDSRPIVGGLCFGMMAGRPAPTIYHLADLDGQITTVRVNDYPRDELVHCAATGAAFLLIHRRVLEAMAEQQFNAGFPWFQETELRGSPVGEDITFCVRAGILGIPIHVNTAVKIGHHKSQLLTEELFDRSQTD